MMWYRMPARLTGLCAMICKTGVFTFLIMNIFNIHNIVFDNFMIRLR